jgi:hypothetical protein
LPSHFGAVAVPVQPPRQLTFAPQLIPALPGVTVQFPVQPPVHVPAQ